MAIRGTREKMAGHLGHVKKRHLTCDIATVRLSRELWDTGTVHGCILVGTFRLLRIEAVASEVYLRVRS